MTTTSLSDAVLDHIPGYRRAEHRHQRLTQLSRIAPPAVDMWRDYRNRLFAAADNNADTLDDLREQYIAQRAMWEGAGAFDQEVAQAIRQAAEDMKTTRITGSRAALDYLRSELHTLMGEVRNSAHLIAAHPDSALDVLSGGAAAKKNWTLVEGLIARYDAIRSEHRKYVRLQDGKPGKTFAMCAQIAEFIDHDPGWLYRRGTAPGAQSHVDDIKAWFGAGHPKRLKPSDINRTSVWPDSHRPHEWLLIVADHQPWLPDAATLTRAENTANQLMDKPFRDASTVSFFRRTVEELNGITDIRQPVKAGALAFNDLDEDID